MLHAHGDFETRSPTEILSAGAHAYSKDPRTEPLCFAWAIGDEDPIPWTPDRPGPIDRLFEHLAAGGLFFAHNAAFERAIWANVMVPRFGWPALPLPQVRCTMAMAYAMALPPSLDGAASALGLAVQKDTEGNKLMKRMAKPRRIRDDGTIEWWDDEAMRARLLAYCLQDVRVGRELEKLLFPLSDFEQEIWELDQQINDRGVPIDLPAVRGAIDVVDAAIQRLDARMREVTGGWVNACSKVVELKDWIDLRGVRVTSLDKTALAELLARDDLPPDVRAALRLRQDAAKSSTAKLRAMVASVCPDGRARGLHQYHGAATGRWAGRRIQTQNFPRPHLKQREIEEILDVCAEPAPDCAPVDTIDMLYGAPLDMISSSLRGCLAAPKGRTFICADFAGIESRGLAFLAGEAWKLDVFRDYDTILGHKPNGDPIRKGPDNYIAAYSNSFGIPVEEVTKDQRQIGKVEELALGYEGSLGAFQQMAAGYGVRLPDKQVRAIVKAWRAAHPATVAHWRACEEAAISAVMNPGTPFKAGAPGVEVRYLFKGSILLCRLPSGRRLSYPFPHLEPYVWVKKAKSVKDEATGEIEFEQENRRIPIKKLDAALRSGWQQNGNPSHGLHYRYLDGMTNQWVDGPTYGGSLVENITQAACRDLLASAMLRLSKRGFEIVMHVHDEVVAEIGEIDDPADRERCLTEFCSIMTEAPEWAAGFPIAAEGWIGRRYRK